MPAQDIGTWEIVFQFITVVAVVTNAGLVSYTMRAMDSLTIYDRTW